MPFMYRVLKCVQASRPPSAVSYFCRISATVGKVLLESGAAAGAAVDAVVTGSDCDALCALAVPADANAIPMNTKISMKKHKESRPRMCPPGLARVTFVQYESDPRS